MPKWIAATALAISLNTSLEAATPELPYEKYRLPNGLDVILSQDRSLPLVAVDIWYHVGAANEEAGRTGFAHLFEHMMFTGSKHIARGMSDSLLEAAGGASGAAFHLLDDGDLSLFKLRAHARQIAERSGQDVTRPGGRLDQLLAQDPLFIEDGAGGGRGRGIECEDPHSNHFRIASLRKA